MPTEPPTRSSRERPERGSSPGSGGQASGSESFCSFCDKPSEEVDALVEGYGGQDAMALAASESGEASSTSSSGSARLRAMSICNDCIDLCKAILDEMEGTEPGPASETDGDDKSHATERAASFGGGSRTAIDLVRQSNQLRDIVAELQGALDRFEQEYAEARREGLQDLVDRLSKLVSDARQRLDTAEEEWKGARSLAIDALIEDSGLEASTPWPRPPVRKGYPASLSCSFCGKSQEAVDKLIEGPTEVCICNECVEIIDEAMRP